MPLIQTCNEMNSNDRPAILLLAPGEAGTSPTGPVIRVMEVGRALAGEHDVTVAFRGDPPVQANGLRVVRAGRMRVLKEALKHDVVMAPWLPPFLIPILNAFGIVSVADLYDPIEYELTAGDADTNAVFRSAQRLTALQLRFADLISCGGTRQREHLIEKASRKRDQGHRVDPVVVRFGVPDSPPISSRHPLRDHLGLGASDFVVLWWGSIWRWLDPATAIRAVALLRERRPDVKLVFSAGVPPDPASQALTKSGAALELAKSLQVLGGSVLFLDKWIPYEQRHEYLADADVGITLHADRREAELAARARYLDYLWCSLPCVLSAGDEFSETLAANGFAALVEPENPEETATAIERLASRDVRDTAALAGVELAGRYRWTAVVEPLSAAIEDVRRAGGSRRLRSLKALGPIVTYYAQRALDAVGRRIKRS